MTVEEFSQLCDPKEVEKPGGVNSPPARAGPTVVGAGSVQDTHSSILVKRTVTVTDRGPSLDDLRTISSLQSKLNSATEIHTKDESKPGGIFSLWFLVGLLPLVAGALIWKLKPSWIGAALAALKTLFGKKT